MLAKLKKNLLAGLRLAPSNAFSAGFDQAVALLLVCVAVIVVVSYPYDADLVRFSWVGVTSWMAIAFALGLLVLIVARLNHAPPVVFATQLLSSAPWFLVLVLIVTRFLPGASWLHELLLYLGLAIVFVIALRSYRGSTVRTVLVLIAAASAVLIIGWYRFFAPAVFYGIYDESEVALFDIDIEQLYHDQSGLIATTLDTLLPQRPGFADVYFVGFAGNGDEPVFKRDLAWVHELFDKRFGTAGRSVSLAATHDTIAKEPLASRYNLRAVLAGIGAMIDPNEDSVFLYLTSHGASAGWLDVSLYPLPSQQLSAQDLKRALDDAGIRWRIIVISACYSGAFIDTLADEQTIVLTAASADRTSFGCGQESEMTWFADAFFRQSLIEGMGLIDAFENARLQIARREADAGYESSDPQIYIGEAMRARLEGIDGAVLLIDQPDGI